MGRYDRKMQRAAITRCLILLACQSGLVVTVSAIDQKPGYPASDWARATPESAGYSKAKLEALRGWLKTLRLQLWSFGWRTDRFEYGDLKRVSKVASVRKSILAMMYGKYCAEGKIDLSRAVKQLELDDVQPFLPIEPNATLLSLLTTRSGIYLPSDNQELTAKSPRRGAQYPGAYFQYQNLDFSAAGTAFEKADRKRHFLRCSNRTWLDQSGCSTSSTRNSARSVQCRSRFIRNTQCISRLGIGRVLGLSCCVALIGTGHR